MAPKNVRVSKDWEPRDPLKKPYPFPVQKLLDFDQWLTIKLAVCAKKDSSYAEWRTTMKAFEYSGHGLLWLFGTSSVLALSSQNPDRFATALNVLLFLLLDICVVAVTKAAARRRRPPVNVDDMFFTVSLDRFSFPSGHCTRSFSLAFIAYDRSPDSYILCTLLFIWATLVSSSRVALGRHHVGDILGGVVIAYVQSLLMVQLFWLSPETAVWIGSSFFGDEGTGIHDSQEL